MPIEKALGLHDWTAHCDDHQKPVQIRRDDSFVRGRVVSIVAVYIGLGMRTAWRDFALYLHAPQTPLGDPIFNRPISFYLFTLPIYDAVSSWLMYLTVIILVAVIAYAVLAGTQETTLGNSKSGTLRKRAITIISVVLGATLLILAWKTLLSRFPYLWQDHQIFSGVSYTEANHVLPGLRLVAIALVIAALVALVNAFTLRKVRVLVAGIALPLAVYLVAVVFIPAYVQNFVVKPNELGRESPYIEHNITWTRRAFGLDKIELRNFEQKHC